MNYPKSVYKDFRVKLVKNETQEKEAEKEGWKASPSGQKENKPSKSNLELKSKVKEDGSDRKKNN